MVEAISSESDAAVDAERRAALRQYDILDTPLEAAFDDIAKIVAHVCQVPYAAISFVDGDRQWFKSEVGLNVRQTGINVSICAHAILEQDLFVVPDTLDDERFKHNALVTGAPNFRFYAGALLRTPAGHALGALCVLDSKPRDLTAEQVEILRALARQVMAQLEFRRTLATQSKVLEQQRLAEHAARESRDAAEAANLAKDRFLAVLSHELRTPLTPVMTAAHMLANDSDVSEDVRSSAAMILRNVELETRLIDDLLDLTRIDRGKMMLHLAEVDLHEQIPYVVDIVRADVRANGLILNVEPRATRSVVRADAARLQQVLWNLVKNAIKFTPTGGTITILTQDLADHRTAVSVRDTGVGIDPLVLPRLFDAFEQGGRDVTRAFGGLGLGLTISKALVEQHGGSLTAESLGHGAGTTMTMTLPDAVAPTSPGAEVPASLPARSAEALVGRILLVEDHPDTAKVMAKLLRQRGHTVRAADTVAGALQAAGAEPFDLVISDLGLPDGTGLDLMTQLLSRTKIRGIAVSGYGMEEDLRASRDAGFMEHITKPINLANLHDVIERVLQQS